MSQPFQDSQGSQPSSQPSSSSATSTPGASSTSPAPERVTISVLARKAIKRPLAPVCNGRVESWSETMAEFNCPICLEVMEEAVITKCGHTFCGRCIRNSFAIKSVCPKCGATDFADQLIPNYAVNEMVARHFSAKALKTDLTEAAKSIDAEPSSILQMLSGNNYTELNLNDIETLMMLLKRKKEVLTVESQEHQRALLSEFLNQLLRVKKALKEQLDKEVNLIEQDLTHVGSMPDVKLETSCESMNNSGSQSSIESMPSSCSSSDIVGFNTQVLNSVDIEQTSMSSRRKRMYSHFEELSRIYMDIRKADLHDTRATDATVPSDGGDSVDFDALDDFGVTLSRISRYSRLKPLATLSYSADLLSSSNIVSSIEFDKDNEFFAIAGVTRKIKLFEYATVIGSAVDIHCPTAELSCSAKISCVAWSSYYKNRLASSDYDGCVSLWDASMAHKTRSLSEHEKRVWSVDWSNGDPRLLASGSDDSKVKLWSTNAERSVMTLEAKANVCCVKFCPQNSFVIAFGCADHCVHYYDFRHPRDPIGVLQGHKKAVSYVKFASKEELVSASTDSHLKLWSLDETMDCVRSFKGHINEKNFVGLATDGNYIACGSENNSLYVYYKYLSRPLFSFKFDNHRAMLEKPRNDESTEFVSAVAWKKGSPVVVAANSQGSIKVLELT